jgi:hypothetical protein
MSDESGELNSPILKTEIPAQVVNEGASFTLRLNDFIQSPDEASGKVQFFAELADGQSLPQGLICTTDGLVTGIPADATRGVHRVVVMAENDSGIPFTASFDLTIKERIKIEDISQHFTDLKAKVWEALGEGLPLPDLGELMDRPLTHDDIYYLLKRYATLKIWDVYNLDPPSEPKLISIEGVSKHYQVFDRGCYIIGVPKDLFTYERTIEDGLLTAKAMANEVYKRGWTVEFTGFGKMARACWVELQLLGDKHEKPIEIIHYNPTPKDMRLYEAESKAEMVFGKKKI